jgi:hypothetical protein
MGGKKSMASDAKSLDRAVEKLILAAELAYSGMAFTLHDITDPRRRTDDSAWVERRGKLLAEQADGLRAALDNLGRPD